MAETTSSTLAHEVCLDVATTVRIEPSTGPAHGVKTRPSFVPSTKPPMTTCKEAAPPLAKPPVRLDSHSNGAGQIISSPNPTSRIEAAVRRVLGSKSNTRVIAPSANATSENDITKPAAIIAGRALLVWPTDAPSRIGSIGSVQGAATVTTPASSARTRLSIGTVRRGSGRTSCPPRAPDVLRDAVVGRYAERRSGGVTTV